MTRGELDGSLGKSSVRVRIGHRAEKTRTRRHDAPEALRLGYGSREQISAEIFVACAVKYIHAAHIPPQSLRKISRRELQLR